MNFVPHILAPSTRTPDAWFFCFHDGKLLVPDRDDWHLVAQRTTGFTPAEAAGQDGLLYLGQLEGIDCWTLRATIVPAGWRVVSLRAALQHMDPSMAPLAARAAQILEWDRAHRYCGVCGAMTVAHARDRARHCEACGHVAYPRISPVAMALIWRRHERRLQFLLARGPHFVPGVFSALAGFVEAGETLEECLVREVREEVGVEVDALRYVNSQSWPFPHSLMVAFTARWRSGDIVRQPDEIEDARWFDIDALPPLPGEFSIAGQLIRGAVKRAHDGLLEETAPNHAG